MSASGGSSKHPSHSLPPSSLPRTPPIRSQSESQSHSQSPSSASSYISYPITHVVSGIYRRLTEPTPPRPASKKPPLDPMSVSEVYNPPIRTASPFQPPPLTPLTLKAAGGASHILLAQSLAEEIRLLVPPRLQLLDTWQLAYSLDRDGSSLATLYEKCKAFASRSQKAGYVLVVKDSSSGPGLGGNGGKGTKGAGGSRASAAGGGALFGAYLTDPPHPASHYYGTGECFLWRASVLPSTPMIYMRTTAATTTTKTDDGRGKEKDITTSGVPENIEHSSNSGNVDLDLVGLPLPPSADTTQLRGRSTTLRGEKRNGEKHTIHDCSVLSGRQEGLSLHNDSRDSTSASASASASKRRDEDGSCSRHGVDLLSPAQLHSASFGTIGNGHAGAGGQQCAPTNLSTGNSRSGSGATSPERIRFKAFPYSGVNDYMMFCETGFLSVGGGDGHYGLWLDDSFEKGVSHSCPTFGNEPLSDEGTKFDVLGVEIWYLGS
ncbi:hypothetical protein PABG_01215 [Paracoccidioides brasiliensis Pb03]|nr:hypothetical protein PABG_01215 [Paracoccidioides brasiliensis Pb03]